MIVYPGAKYVADLSEVHLNLMLDNMQLSVACLRQASNRLLQNCIQYSQEYQVLA